MPVIEDYASSTFDRATSGITFNNADYSSDWNNWIFGTAHAPGNNAAPSRPVIRFRCPECGEEIGEVFAIKESKYHHDISRNGKAGYAHEVNNCENVLRYECSRCNANITNHIRNANG